MKALPAAALLAFALSLPLAALASPDPALAPYRALAASPAAARLLALARAGIEARWSGAPVDTAGVPGWPGPPVALYLSLVRGGATRACVGTSASAGGTLAARVRGLAIEALSADRRRPPLRRDEIADVRIVLAFAGPPVPVADPMSVDPAREGLLVGGAGGHVAFLPGEARTVAWALREARRARVLAGGLPEYSRFDAVTLAEPERPAHAGGRPDEDE